MIELKRLSHDQSIAILSVGKPVWIIKKSGFHISKITSANLTTANNMYYVDTTTIVGNTIRTSLGDCDCYTSMKHLFNAIQKDFNLRIEAANNILKVQEYFLDKHPDLCV